jgi:hypothetical protein
LNAQWLLYSSIKHKSIVRRKYFFITTRRVQDKYILTKYYAAPGLSIRNAFKKGGRHAMADFYALPARTDSAFSVFCARGKNKTQIVITVPVTLI